VLFVLFVGATLEQWLRESGSKSVDAVTKLEEGGAAKAVSEMGSDPSFFAADKVYPFPN
jgi:hypothetical protein